MPYEARILSKASRANATPDGYLSSDPGVNALKIIMPDGRVGWDDWTFIFSCAHGSHNELARQIARREVSPVLVRNRDDCGRGFSPFPYLPPDLFFVKNVERGVDDGEFEHGIPWTIMTGNPWLEKYAVTKAHNRIMEIYRGDWPYCSTIARSDLYLQKAARDLAILGYPVNINKTTRELARRVQKEPGRRLELDSDLGVKVTLVRNANQKRFLFYFCL